MDRRLGILSLILLLVAALTSPSAAQAPPVVGDDPGFGEPFSVPGFDTPEPDLLGPSASFSAEYRVEKGTRIGRLEIKADIQPDWHIYSTTQPSGGPLPTKIKITPSQQFEVTGELKPNVDPVVTTDDVFPGVNVEKMVGEFRWTAPIQIAENVDPDKVKIQVKIDGQACDKAGTCQMITETLADIRFAGYYEPPVATGEFAEAGKNVTILGHVEPKVAAPGNTVTLVITAKLAPEWHVYRYAPKTPDDPNAVSRPTLIVLRKTSGWEYEAPQVSSQPIKKESGLTEEPYLYYHEGTVTWRVPIRVPADAAPGSYTIAGSIGYQTCTPSVCDQPTGADFEVSVAVADQSVDGQLPLVFTPASYGSVAAHAEAAQTRTAAAEQAGSTEPAESQWSDKSLATVLILAFLAGLILNVMPCVLPVIGLKIMSFVQQAGGNRWEIFSLNMWFSFGMLTVFWILAGAAAFANKGWGEHFQSVGFTVTLTGVVFAFGLSFLGVWEIPIPGFVSSGTMQKTAAKEGPAGAFSKGVLSTVLATPCAGPLIVPAVSWAVTQPPSLTFLAFTFIGLGMATPYLLIGLFPRLISHLPKPGAWMETFKQLMGFLLMATVVWLFTSLEAKWVIPTLTLLLGIGLACWYIGRVPLTVSQRDRAMAWALSLLITAVSVVLGFIVFAQTHEWEPFTQVTLDNHRKEGRTVLVDFTANW
jgi:thiol:disulfide interchange protein